MPVNFQFDEILLDPNLFTLGDAIGGPEFANTNIRNPGTGVMGVNITRYDPQHVWNFDFKMVTPSFGGGSNNEMDYFNQIWYGGWGSAYGFRVRVETDHIALAEVLGTSTGSLADWKLTRKYNRPGTTTHPYFRQICKPVVTSNLTAGSATLYEPDGSTARAVEIPFQVFANSTPVAAAGNWSINNVTGVLHLISFASFGAGVSISWSGQFDTPMRFFTNSIQQRHDFPAEIKGLQLVEIMPAELGL